MLPVTRLPVWRGGRHQLPPSFPRSPGIIPAALSEGFSGPRAATVLSRNGPRLKATDDGVKPFLFTSSSPTDPVNNLGAILFTACSPWRGPATEHTRASL